LGGNSIAYIGLGSNLGDREENCKSALSFLGSSKSIEIRKVSSFYSSSPVGYLEQPNFVNGAAEVSTDFAPHELYSEMARVEKRLRKNTPFENGPRTIDLDLLMFDELISSDTVLTLPHPRMHKRRFVLEPLVEIAPNLIHPILKQSVKFLRDSLEEVDYVQRIDHT